jgi:hypothetical protein
MPTALVIGLSGNFSKPESKKYGLRLHQNVSTIERDLKFWLCKL